MIVCVAGNPSIDKLFVVDAVLPGAIHRPLELVQVPGGKGLNVARVAVALGADVRAVGILGGHAGRWMAEALQAEGIRGSFAWMPGETRSSLSVADRETDGLTEFYEAGPHVPDQAWQEMEDVVAALLPGATWVTMSGSLAPGVPLLGYARLVGMARRTGARAALDAHGPALELGVGAGPDIVKVNASEASDLLDAPVEAEADAIAAARTIRERAGAGDQAALVTRGGDGAVLVAPDGTVWTGSLYLRGPYPVGSGDAFLAGLVVARERGEDWPDALRLALGAGTANAEMPGAGRLDGARATALADRATVRRIG